MYSSQYLTAPRLGADGTVSMAKFPQEARTTVLVDSRDRNTAEWPTSSAFVVNLPQPLHNVSSAKLVTAEIPLTFYAFSAARGTNAMAVSLDAASATVTIPDGNYTTSSLTTALKSALDTALTGPFTVTIDAASLRCTIAATGTVSVTGDAGGTDLAYLLGFPAGVTSGAGGVVAPAVVRLNPEQYLVIEIEELNGLLQTAPPSRGVSGRPCFSKVPLRGDSFSYESHDLDMTRVDLRPQLTRLEKLRVSLRFHDGTLVDLNGAEWSLTLDIATTLVRSP